MKPNLEDRIVQGLESFADALEKGEDVTKRFTRRKVVLNLEPRPYDPELVKETRRLMGMSQAMFAQFLGVSVQAVQKWEQGRGKPEPIACRFMDEIRTDPDHWRRRVLELAQPKSQAGC
jgi:putative transcriptional regulator